MKNAIKFELIFNDANVKRSEKKNSQQVLGGNRWQDTVTRTSINWCNGLFIRSFDHLAKWSIWNVIGPFVEGLAGDKKGRRAREKNRRWVAQNRHRGGPDTRTDRLPLQHYLFGFLVLSAPINRHLSPTRSFMFKNSFLVG